MSETHLDVEQLSFEQAFAELEATIKKLETGNLPLAEALALYERGMALSKCCSQHLDQAELKIQALTPAGELVDFEE